MAYIGSPFIATEEARAAEAYKQAIVDGAAVDIVYSNFFTGVHGNYLKPSIRAAGMDPDNLPEADPSKMDFEAATTGAKAWKDIWGSGQGSAPSKLSNRSPRSSIGWRRNTIRHVPDWHSENAGSRGRFFASPSLFCRIGNLSA